MVSRETKRLTPQPLEAFKLQPETIQDFDLGVLKASVASGAPGLMFYAYIQGS